MTEQTGEVCLRCRQLVQTYRFQVLIVERTRTRTYPMQMCGACAHQLTEILADAADKPPEVLDAIEGSRSAQESSKGSATDSAQAGGRPDATRGRAATKTRA